MEVFKMSNPILANVMDNNGGYTSSVPMTVQGTVNKLFLMFALLCTSFGVVFYQYLLGYMDKVNTIGIAGLFVGLVCALVICFTRKAMWFFTPVYAFAEGACLGWVSAYMNAQYPGIVVQSVILTFLALFSLLFLYKLGAIKATEKFKSTITIAVTSIFVFYLVSYILTFFHISMPVLYSSSPFGIAFSLFVCGVAALSLIIDFDFIEKGAMNGFDKQYEWYGAFGLMATLIWLYIEILNLLAKLSRR